MDEIICPECGRPNLSEAEKCWYCQVSLVKNGPDAGLLEQISDPAADKTSVENPTGKSPVKDDSSEDLPDWLKRIRELKKADQPLEEIDQWQQEKLFAGQAGDSEDPLDQPEFLRRISKPRVDAESRPAIPEVQPMLEETPMEKKSEAHDEAVDSKPDPSDEDLPDGFTPFKTESDQER
jgi:hypothetical protein